MLWELGTTLTGEANALSQNEGSPQPLWMSYGDLRRRKIRKRMPTCAGTSLEFRARAVERVRASSYAHTMKVRIMAKRRLAKRARRARDLDDRRGPNPRMQELLRRLNASPRFTVAGSLAAVRARKAQLEAVNYGCR